MNELRIAYAGDRDISVWVLKYLLDQGVKPKMLFVSGTNRASHAEELIALCRYLPDTLIIRGNLFRKPEGLALLKSQALDYIIGIHFPYLIPEDILSMPKYGVLNLHPAFLPFNRGWHTPSWAILDDTPIGATLHFMTKEIDQGDIIHQQRLDISPGDTADSLYKKIKHLEFTVFKDAWPRIQQNTFQRVKQSSAIGSYHVKEDLFKNDIKYINLNEIIEAGSLINKLRALSTNEMKEAAYYEVDGKKFYIQVQIREECE